MEYQNISLNNEGAIAVVTITREAKLNALNRATIQELHRVFQDLQKATEIKVIILTGSGGKAFMAGADISEFAHFSPQEGADLAAMGQELLFNFIENFPKPVIAAVNGYALGGGLELAMACHIRIASHNAKMGLPEVSLGVIPGYGGTQRLPQLIGKGRAMELIMSAGMIDAEKAMEYGLVNHFTAQEELLPYCKKLAQKIANNSTVAIAHAIKAVNAGFKKDLDGFKTEITSFGSCFGSDDFKEGTSAFLEKRKPSFPGT